jgi:hypothetical protein
MLLNGQPPSRLSCRRQDEFYRACLSVFGYAESAFLPASRWTSISVRENAAPDCFLVGYITGSQPRVA